MRAFHVLLVALALLTLARASAARERAKPCMSANVGEVLSAKIAAHALDGALPPGWVLEEIGVEADHIDLGTLDGDKHPHNVSLRLAERAEDVVAGRGKWFAFVLDPKRLPTDDAGRRGLLELAARVDAAVAKDEAVRICGVDGRLPVWVAVGAAFFAVVLVGVVVALWRSRRKLLSREAVFPTSLTVLALVVRFAAHAGPGDIRQVLEAGVSEGFPPRAGWSCLLRLMFAVLPPRYPSVWAVHRVVGALAVPLLYCALRQRFTRRSAAAAGAAALAVLPLAARFSASDTPYIPLCTTFLGAVVALTQFRRAGSYPSLALGVLLLTASMQLRPDGPWLFVPAAIVVLTVPTVRKSTLFRPATLLAGAVFLALNALPSLWSLAGHNRVGDGSLGAYAKMNFVLVGSLIGSPWTDLEMSPWPLSLLVLAGLVLALRAGKSGIGWALATSVAMPLDFPATAQYANARYHLPAVYLACGLAGLAADALASRLAERIPGRVDRVFLAAALAVLAAVPRFDLLTRMWTPQEEFEFYRAGLARLDPECTIVTLMDGNDAGFVPFSDPGLPVAVDVGVFLEKPPRRADVCFVYYQAANCRSADAVGLPSDAPFEENTVCREMTRRATLTPIAETRLRARPYRGERYSVDPIPVGFYRIGGVSAP